MGYKEEFIEFMVRSNVLTFGDFVTKSGRKTPFFINTGNYKTGEQISRLGGFYAEAVKNKIGTDFTAFFGPAYKGIPLSVTAAIALYRDLGINKAFCFNRKEAKDHGEGGSLIGYKPVNGDKIVIIEDVTTAGTSIRESIPLLKAAGDVEITALIVSVDRMEKGTGTKTALKEIEETFGIKTCAIVNIHDIVKHLLNRPIDGKIVLNEEIKTRILDYFKIYGAVEDQ